MRRVWLAVLSACAVLGIAAFALLAWAVTSEWEPLAATDQATAQYFGDYAAARPAWVTFWVVVGIVGNPVLFQVLAALALAGVITAAVRRGGPSSAQRRTIALLLLGVGGGGLISLAVKAIVARERPEGAAVEALGNSFPSGHALGVAAAVGAVLIIGWPWLAGWRRATAVAVGAVVVALVSFDRIALDVHYVSDVLAGIALGVGWVCAVALLCEHWWPTQSVRSRSSVTDPATEPADTVTPS